MLRGLDILMKDARTREAPIFRIAREQGGLAVSLADLPEYRGNALMAIAVAAREARHLASTTHPRFSRKMDLLWAEDKRMGWEQKPLSRLEKLQAPQEGR